MRLKNLDFSFFLFLAPSKLFKIVCVFYILDQIAYKIFRCGKFTERKTENEFKIFMFQCFKVDILKDKGKKPFILLKRNKQILIKILFSIHL